METRQITLGDADVWQQIRANVPAGHLLHQDDFCQSWYSGNQPWSALWGVFRSDRLLGVIASETIDFVSGSKTYALSVGTNFYSFEPGAGIALYQRWVSCTGFTLTFGGSSDFHRFKDRVPNVFEVAIPHFVLNRQYAMRGESGVRKLLKATSNLTRLGRVNVPRRIESALQSHSWSDATATEVQTFSKEIVWEEEFCGMRQQATAEYLNWRYANGKVPYQKYEVRRNGEHVGNVVIGQSRARLIVAFSQATTSHDATMSALVSVAHSLNQPSADSKKEVFLSCCHPMAQSTLREIGFSESSYRRPFVVLGESSTIDLPREIEQWHVDFDIADNGVRYLGLG